MAESNYPTQQIKSNSRRSSLHDSQTESTGTFSCSSDVQNAVEKSSSHAHAQIFDLSSSSGDETDVHTAVDNKTIAIQPKQQQIFPEIDSDEEDGETIKRENSSCQLNDVINNIGSDDQRDQQKKSNYRNTSKSKKDKHSQKSNNKQRANRKQNNEKTITQTELSFERLRSIIPSEWTIIDPQMCGKTHQGSIVKLQSTKNGLAIGKIYIFKEKNSDELLKLRTRALHEKTALIIIKDMDNVPQFIGSNIPNSVNEIAKLKEPLWTITSYSSGCSLMELIENWKKNTTDIQPMESIRFCQKLLKIVKCLHSKKIIHRDIKPANVIVDCDKHNLDRICSHCELTLIDYGLAYIRTETTNLSMEKYRSSQMDQCTVTELQEDIGHSWCRVPQLAKSSDSAVRQMTDLEKYERKQLRRSPTTDSSGVCAILFTLITKEHPGSIRTSSGLQPHGKYYNKLRNLISKSFTDKDLQARMESYLMDTFDRGFGFPDIQWTTEQLEYRFNLLLDMMDGKSNEKPTIRNQMIQNNTFDEQSITQLKLGHILVRRSNFTQVAQAFSRAKKTFIRQSILPDYLQWSSDSCQWTDDVNVLHEKKHFDVLSCSHPNFKWLILVIFHCYIDELSDVIKLSIGTVIDGVTILLPVARFDETVEIQMIDNRFIIELDTLIKLTGKNIIIPDVEDLQLVSD